MKVSKFLPVEPEDKRLPFNCVLFTNQAAHQVESHWHDTYEIDYVISGMNANFYLNEKTFNQKAGEIVCINPYEIHGLDLPKTKNRIAMTVMIPIAFLEQVNINNFQLKLINLIPKSDNKNYLLLHQLFNELYHLLSLKNEDQLIRVEKIGIVYTILGILFRHFAQRDDQIPENYASNRYIYIQKALKWLQNNYMQEVSIRKLASQVSLSSSYFSHIFKQVVGKTPQNYLQEIRVAHARQLIQNNDVTMTQIAIEVGFANTKAMNKAFKKVMKITPYQYKLKKQKAGFDIF